MPKTISFIVINTILSYKYVPIVELQISILYCVYDMNGIYIQLPLSYVTNAQEECNTTAQFSMHNDNVTIFAALYATATKRCDL